MSKITMLSWVFTGSLVVYADLPLHFLFGIVFVGIMIELNKIERKMYPIVSNIVLSSVVGWATSFGVKHFKPELFDGEMKIFSIFITTLFAYVTFIYFLKNETIQKFLEKRINKDNGSSSDS